jgi:DNA invertase Pin-like site-specific DNA recombinase
MTVIGQLMAREYRRLSNRKGGTSIARQGTDNTIAAADNDWRLHGEPYIDDGLSASRYARRKRDDFEKLVADLRSGPTGRTSDFGADVLMLWESSRGSRKVGEWVDFIELCEAKKVFIWVTTHDRLYDPRNGRDRKSLLEDAVDSEYESYKTHRRTSATIAYQAGIGRPHAAPPDGLMPVYDERTGDLLTWVEDPERAHIPRELFRLLEAGVTISEVARRFAKAGYLNRSGRPYTREHLRQSALKYAYAGLRFYNGKAYEGVWDGIVDKERFWAVQRILSSPERRKTRTGRATHVLTGSLWCIRCEKPITRVRSDVAYQCMACGLRIQKAPLDELIIGSEETGPDGEVRVTLGVLLKWLARKENHRLLMRSGSGGEELRTVRGRLAQARAERDEFRGAKASNVSQALIIANSLEDKEREVRQLEERERELTMPPSVLKMIAPGAHIWDRWQAAPISARRDVARAILQPHRLGRPYIEPSPTRGRYQPIAERIAEADD